MPRKRQHLAPQAPGMEAGAGYGEQGQNLAAQDPAQGGVPLPDRSAPPGASPPPPLPVEQATSFTPGLTPLTAPGSGAAPGSSVPQQAPPVTPSQQAAVLLRQWGQTTGDQRMLEAAVMLENG